MWYLKEKSTHTGTHAHTHRHMHPHTCKHTHRHMYTHTHTCIYIHIQAHTHIQRHSHIGHMYTYTEARSHRCTHRHAQRHMCTYAYTQAFRKCIEVATWRLTFFQYKFRIETLYKPYHFANDGDKLLNCKQICRILYFNGSILLVPPEHRIGKSNLSKIIWRIFRRGLEGNTRSN